jgi:hypothetical protein
MNLVSLTSTTTIRLSSQFIILQINPTLSSTRPASLSKSSSPRRRTQTLLRNCLGYPLGHNNKWLPISVKSSWTPVPILALVSKNKAPVSVAYSLPSSKLTWRPFSSSSARSALFPANAIIIPGDAWRWSSFIHDWAFVNDADLVMS